MSVLEVPVAERKPYPSLGGEVVAWMEANLVFGPGDLRGEPYRLDEEKQRLVWRVYEVYPRDHPQAGRRRFRRAAVSMRKGTAKSEMGAAIAAVELAPDGPVRCDGWRKDGREWWPVGRPVKDPYIPMLAYTEEQSEELAYQALYVMLSEGPRADGFDFGKERIMRVGGDGKAAALATAPDSRDGARTTFELFDETHRLVLPNQREAHRTMLANLPKRRIADPWALEVTTSPKPGEMSVAEMTMDYAKQVQSGAKSDARLFFFHRQATEGAHDLTTREGVRAAVLEASGPNAEWSDIDGIVEQWDDPTADRAYLARVWLNMLVQSAERAFDMARWADLERAHGCLDGTPCSLGFDGSRVGDHTALVATCLACGYQWVLGIWDPADHGGEIPTDAVTGTVDDAFARLNVVRMYADPPYWKDELASWMGRHGDEVILKWETWRNRPMGFAVRAYAQAINAGALGHAKDPLFAAHVGACHRREVNDRDDKGERLWTVQKERPDSPHKIDAAVAAVLSWEARMDAIAKGALTERAPYFTAVEAAAEPEDDDGW